MLLVACVFAMCPGHRLQLSCILLGVKRQQQNTRSTFVAWVELLYHIVQQYPRPRVKRSCSSSAFFRGGICRIREETKNQKQYTTYCSKYYDLFLRRLWSPAAVVVLARATYYRDCEYGQTCTWRGAVGQVGDSIVKRRL